MRAYKLDDIDDYAGAEEKETHETLHDHSHIDRISQGSLRPPAGDSDQA
jgi:hypothetical protein